MNFFKPNNKSKFVIDYININENELVAEVLVKRFQSYLSEIYKNNDSITATTIKPYLIPGSKEFKTLPEIIQKSLTEHLEMYGEQMDDISNIIITQICNQVHARISCTKNKFDV
jgi:hypothetical protein